MAQNAPIDENSTHGLLGVSSVDFKTPITAAVNPVTHRVLVDLGGAGAGVNSINSDTTAAQVITGGTGISVATVSGTTTITNTQSAGTGTVTAVSVATANGFSGSSSGGATPALTIVAGAITPTSVASTGAVTGTNLSGTNTGDQSLAGLQATLVSATNIKTINGTTLLGSGDLVVGGADATKLPLAGGTLSGLLTLATGSTILAPLKMVAGVNLTTAVAGVFEFDGTNLYFSV